MCRLGGVPALVVMRKDGLFRLCVDTSGVRRYMDRDFVLMDLQLDYRGPWEERMLLPMQTTWSLERLAPLYLDEVVRFPGVPASMLF